MFTNIFFRYNLAVGEMVWKNVVEPERPKMTIWRIHISRWVPKATNDKFDVILTVHRR